MKAAIHTVRLEFADLLEVLRLDLDAQHVKLSERCGSFEHKFGRYQAEAPEEARRVD